MILGLWRDGPSSILFLRRRGRGVCRDRGGIGFGGSHSRGDGLSMVGMEERESMEEGKPVEEGESMGEED